MSNMSTEIVLTGFFSSLAAGLATGTRALPVLFTKKASDLLFKVILGFSAGVMQAANAFSLIEPAFDLNGSLGIVFGSILRVLAPHLIHRFVPHFHPALGAKGLSSKLAKFYPFVLSHLSHFNVSKVGMN